MSYYEYHVAKRYVQFEGALRELPNYAALIGQKVLFLTACGPVRVQVESKIREGLSHPAATWLNPRLASESVRYSRYASMTDHLNELRSKMKFEFYDIGDSVVSEENIRRVAAYVKNADIDTVVGIGGGKGMDFARALTHFLPLKIILVPTSTATNASISTLSVLYTPDGSHISEYWRMDNAPELVLADTELLVENGPRILSSGIGDITSTYYEALCNLEKTGLTDILPPLSYGGIQLATESMQKLVPGAMQAVREKKINSAYERVVSMILHNCGPMGMICTPGFAHVLDEVFLYFDAAHRTPHGLRVGFATIPMLLYQCADENKIKQYLHFCNQAGIPTTLRELGLEQIDERQWQEAFDATAGKSGTLEKLPIHVTKEEMIGCLLNSGKII